MLATAIREQKDIVLEGVLHCSNPDCQLEYPIIDGIPIIVPHMRDYISENLFHLTARDDLSETIEGIVSDAVGPGTAFDSTRQHLSTYAWDNYGDLDKSEPQVDLKPGAVVRCLEMGLELIHNGVEGPVIDLGCSVGRSTFALAQQCDGLVLGVDINFSMLRLAQRLLQSGIVRYPRRRVGIVYDRREFEVQFEHSDRVDFWLCDTLALPFSNAGFGLAVGLNVLDCVASPLDFLASVRRMLRTGGHVILATPYDWSPGATAVEAWIGGHSQRGPDRGASEPFLKSLLIPGGHPQSIDGFKLLDEVMDVPWQARLYDRSTVSYSTHLVVAEAVSS